MKITCPFCNAELDSSDDVPTVVKSTIFNSVYICHKVICYNKDKHPDKNKIVVVFNTEGGNK